MNDTDRIYEGLLEDLFSRHPSVQTSGFTAGAYKPGLSGMLRFDAALGHPSRGFRSIHVAGTNGKGSVSSMLAAALSATGLRVGLYTSPHLVDFRERIKLVEPDGWSMIPREEVFRFLTENDLEGLSFFEITTGLAFWWFAAQQVDVAVIEVGLGGLLGLVRGVIVSLLVLYLVPVLIQVVRPEFAESLRSGSRLYSLITQMDYLNVGNMIHGLIGA